MTDLTSNILYDAITQTIRDFPWNSYGLRDVEPISENADWVPDIATQLLKAVAPDAVRDPQLLARFRDRYEQVWLLLLADDEQGPRLVLEEDRDRPETWQAWHVVAQDELTRI